ncbi:uncharacterized protein FJT64_018524 [Amphibalanus amphitrite]|uniref:SH3 domain-binding protein 5-like n=1 Tax=Amphibalanus amphitrite TaxID=1232801 RepID=A0A6A4X7V9_AMPAM|nr:uncharacterized protein FJT64_018524 [Amphibalanus amphitrite]
MSEVSEQSEREQQNRLDLIHPQIHVELEQLNCATDSINKLELELDALQRTQDAAVLYERATSHHQAAKELVALAEEGLTSQGHAFDQSWQEMLNHSTEKVNRAEYDRTESAKNHELCSREYQRIDGRVKQLQKELKREIARSRPYFEMKAHFNQLMEMQKRQVSELESEVQASKLTYSQTLRRLEEISNQIHQARGTEEAAAALRAATGGAGGARSPPALENGAIGRLGPAGRSGMSTSSTLPSLLGEDPLGLDDEFYPPPYRVSGSRSHLQLYRNGDSGREQRLSVPRDDDRSDTESLASVSTVSSVDPLSDQQIGYIALDDELQEVAAGATCVVNHNFSLSPLDGPGHDNIDQAVARLSAARPAEAPQVPVPSVAMGDTAEERRLSEDRSRTANWKRWGPYLSERQWGTVREDYSADGNCWDYFSHDQARSRAYRWGEDGLLGIADRQCRLCFSVALWNGKDPILKERLFGVTGPEGNHGEDCKECYYYLDSTPTHSYMKALYKYPQNEYPYQRLVQANQERGIHQPELELEDTGVFDESRYWDVTAEYAKSSPNNVLIQITVANRGPEDSTIHVIPTLWFRNTWSWGCTHEGCTMKPRLASDGPSRVRCTHETLHPYCWEVGEHDGKAPELLFTENETNHSRLFGGQNRTPFVKDSINEYVVHGKKECVNPKEKGTKVGAHYVLHVPAGQTVTLQSRLYQEDEAVTPALGEDFKTSFNQRKSEADAFYAAAIPARLSAEETNVARQGLASLLWTKQFYHYVVKDWMEGDPDQPKPPQQRLQGRNSDWMHLFNRDIISMPDNTASWDLAFHMIPFALVDIDFAKDQLMLFLREWYMHPNGQIPGM